jgi:NADPH:quinone reductase-like Zn-dependent oxidoreductase
MPFKCICGVTMVEASGEKSGSGKITRCKDKAIVITGASDGIGAAAAHLSSAKGAQVVIVGRLPQKTKKIVELLHAG